MVAAGRAFVVKKYLEVHGWACCRPASGHTVRGVSERGPAINQEPHHIQN